jgi:hypothetical protein
MQTFLPSQNFSTSAQILDYRRLGKQRVEAYQLWLGQWPNHPAAKMWFGYREALALYTNTIIEEWIGRGYKNNMDLLPVGEVVYPPWLGSDIHATHRSNLLRKDPEYYSQFNWVELDDMEYIWPTKESAIELDS